jgi:hypothetical protein
VTFSADQVQSRPRSSHFEQRFADGHHKIEPGNRRHEFVAHLFKAQAISIVPLNRIDRFAEELRLRLGWKTKRGIWKIGFAAHPRSSVAPERKRT